MKVKVLAHAANSASFSKTAARFARYFPLLFAALGGAALLLPGTVRASSIDDSTFYLDVTAFAGYSTMTVPSGAKPPTLSQGGGGVTFGYLFSSWLAIGASSDFRVTTQYLDVDPAVGNRSGSRWNLVSPTLMMVAGHFLLKADYELLGDFKLANLTAAGQSLSFSAPAGYRVNLQYLGFPFAAIHFGAYYEKIQYGAEVTGTTRVTLSPKLEQWQAGLALSYMFMGGDRRGWDLGF